jgi:TonB family protein
MEPRVRAIAPRTLPVASGDLILKIAPRRRFSDVRRWAAFGASLALHFTAAAALVSLRVTVQSDFPDRAQYRVLPLPAPSPKKKIQWYELRRTIPEIAPQYRYGPAATPQGQQSPRTLIVHSPNPISSRQVILQQDRPVPLPADVPAPDMIVTRVKPAPRKFVPPSPQSDQPHPNQPAPEPPKLLEPAPLLNTLPASQRLGPEFSTIKLPPRRFVPPATSREPQPPAQALPAAPALTALPEGIQAVVANATPPDRLIIALPEGSRPAQIAHAPEPGPVSSGVSPDSAPKIADLVSRGIPGNAPTAISNAPPAPPVVKEVVKETVFRSLPRTMAAPLRPSSRVIPPAVEAQFANRNVYTFVIPDVGLPEYSGDWVLWFAEDASASGEFARISAPVPARKYAPSADVLSAAETSAGGAIQIAARIDSSGRVSAARVLRGPGSEAFRRRAADELQSWEFEPALRNGTPIAVDVVVELPFQPRKGVRQAAQ